MRKTGRDDKIIRFVLLQHQPHCLHVVARESPVPRRVQVSQSQAVIHALLDPRHGVADLAGHKLQATPRRLMIKQDSRTGEQVVTLTVIHGDPVTVGFGHSVGAARVQGGRLSLRNFANLAEDLAARSLVELDLRIEGTNGLQDASHAERGHLGGEHRLIPGGEHVGLRPEVVNLVRLVLSQQVHQRPLVVQIPRDELHILEDVRYPHQGIRAGPAHHPNDAVALCQQELGQI